MNDRMQKLFNRFMGVDLQGRRWGSDWPKPWRAALVVGDNGLDAYRLTGFGDTPDAALEGEVRRVDEVRS